MCPGVAVGGTFPLNGVTYTKRDRNGLLGLVQDSSKWPELSTSCTTGVDDMSYMWVLNSPAVRPPAPTRPRSRSLRASLARSLARFYKAQNFNQDLSGWVVNNVKDCTSFCYKAGFNPTSRIPSFPGSCGNPGC